jgi:hypothetical protein
LRSGWPTEIRFRFYDPKLFTSARPVVLKVMVRQPDLQLAPPGETCSPFGDDPFATWRVAAVGHEGGVLTVDVR